MTIRRARVVGLIGGIGSGKSTLARWLGEQLGAPVIDADEAGHRALTREDVRQKIRDSFGPEVFDEDGAVSRARLAERVFGAAESRQELRNRLEQIVHPVICEEIERALARVSQSSELVLLDAAVLLEAGWNGICDAVVFVDAPRAVRAERVRASRQWSADELAQREASQWPLERKQQSADVIIDNSGTIESAGARFLDWYHTWSRSPGGRHRT